MIRLLTWALFTGSYIFIGCYLGFIYSDRGAPEQVDTVRSAIIKSENLVITFAEQAYVYVRSLF